MALQNTDRTANLIARSASSMTTMILLFAAVTVWAFVTGYYRMFTYFGTWDDEGYLMMTVKQFLAGDVLYKEIWTLYGPAYYIYKWIVHGLLALPNTHDCTRLITLTMWVLMSLLGGLLVYRLTNSALGAAAAYVLSFLGSLPTLAFIPAHPQELCGVLIIAGLLLLTGDNQKRSFNLLVILIGALLASVLLTKINIGVFFGLALAITFTAFTAASRLQRLALIGLSAAAMLLPFALLRKQFAAHWFELSAVAGAVLIAVLLVVLSENNRVVFSPKHHALATLSFAAAAALMFFLAMPADTAPGVLLDGLIVTPLRFSGYPSFEGAFHRAAAIWAAIAIGAAAALLFYGKRQPRAAEITVLLLKTMFGLTASVILPIGCYNTIIVFVEKASGLSLNTWFYENPSSGHLIILNFATPFLWLLLIKQSPEQKFAAHRVVRTALALTAVLQTLQIYPIPLTNNLMRATFLIVIAGVVCLCDAFADFKRLFPRSLEWRPFYLALTTIAAATMIFFGTYETYAAKKFYNRQFALGLGGSSQMRLSEAEAAGYRFLIENAKINCDSFVTMPGMFSFNFWADKPTPTAINVTGWMRFISDSEQNQIVEQLKTSSDSTLR